MKRIIFLSLVLFYIFAGAQPPDEDPASYRLVFEDDFDTLCHSLYTVNGVSAFTDVDTSKWISIAPWMMVVPEYIVLDYCNNVDTIREKISYRRWCFENAEIDTTGPGIIKLIAKKEDFYAPYFTIGDNEWWILHNDSDRVFHYSNQMLFSKHKYKYGYFEIRFRLPYYSDFRKLYGIGPNFWLWGSYNKCFGYKTEIDIFEYDGAHFTENGSFDINYHSNNIHYMPCSSSCSTCDDTTDHTVPSHSEPSVDFSDGKFHTMAVKWLPDEISFYVEGVKTRTYTTGDFTPDMLAPMNIFVDINVPAKNYCHVFDENYAAFPYVYEVDYVKVWSIERCNEDFSTCHLNTSQYDNNAVYNTITIGEGSNCHTELGPGDDVQLKANKVIRLKPGFKADSHNGSHFKAEIIPCDTIETSTIVE